MEKLIDRLSAVVAEAFSAAGYDPACGRVTVSNRPDLCEFQCNGAMPAAKQHHKAPLVIAPALSTCVCSLHIWPPIWSRCARASASA